MRIRSKFLVFSLVISIAPFLLMSGLSLWQSRAALSNQAFNQLESLREAKKTEIEKFFHERAEDLGLLLDSVGMFYHGAVEKLRATGSGKRAQLQDYFTQRYNDLKVLAAQESVAQALEQYEGAMKMEGKAGGETWLSVDGTAGDALRSFRTQYAYYDLLLIAKDGDVVFTARQGADLGQNVSSGALKDSGLGRIFAAAQQGVAIEDFSPYATSGNTALRQAQDTAAADNQSIAFLGAPVFRFGDLSGVVVLALSTEPINAILHHREGMGKTGETFVIGRSNGVLAYRGERMLANSGTGYGGVPAHGGVPTYGGVPAQDAPPDAVEAGKALTGFAGVNIKMDDDNGVLRLVGYAPLAVEGLEWAVLASMNLEEAITPSFAEKKEDFFTQFLHRYHYDELLLIYPNGKVFYTVNGHKDYGANLLESARANGVLPKIMLQARDTGKFSMSDYALYPSSGAEPVAFMAQPLLARDGKAVELIVVLQLNAHHLDSFMRERAGLGKTGETYLVGQDRLMRSNSVRAPQTHSMRASFTDPEQGKVNTTPVTEALTGKTGRLQAANYLNEPVLSAYTPLLTHDRQWALIAEISQDEAFASIHELEWWMGGITLAMAIVIWFFVNGFTARLVSPLQQVNSHLKIMARGRLAKEPLEYQGRDEIAEIVRSSEQLKNAFRATIMQANAIAAGDFSKDVQLLSDQDQLGLALSGMTNTLRAVIRQAEAIAAGNLGVETRLLSEGDQLGAALRKMTQVLREVSARDQEARQQLEHENTQKSQQDWIKTGLNQLNERMGGEQDIATLGDRVLAFVASYAQAQVGTLYLYRDADGKGQGELKLIAAYAYQKRKRINAEFAIGEGLAGQAALERRMLVISEVPDGYMPIQSSLGEANPRNLALLPLVYENHLKGVMELGRFAVFSDTELEFLQQAMPAVAVAMNSAEARVRLRELLEQSRAQAHELQNQAEELQAQQEELRQANEELESRTQVLERQQEAIREKNRELEQTRVAIEQKAEELSQASKYKSEFLANMSHELRTPLNSLLILAQMLEQNKDGNLTAKQVDFAHTIHNAGADLLRLINEILDLAKVEAGRLEIHCEEYPLASLQDTLQTRFAHMARDKGLEFTQSLAPDLPSSVYTDPQRLLQIVVNLLSNAFKFTETGGQVALTVARTAPGTVFARADLSTEKCLAIRVQDTGIGIPAAKQQQIFEAFQQADGTTSRRYGGTGLGLSISRELANLLNGELQLHSEEGKGSAFTLFIPERHEPAAHAPMNGARHGTIPAFSATQTVQNLPTPSAATPAPAVLDDRQDLQAHDNLLLIIEDDRDFAQTLRASAHEKNFKCILAEDGKTGLELATQYHPHAFILDVGLPLSDGWTVMEQLKENPDTRHIPVHFISGQDERRNAKAMGAIGYLLKPVSLHQLGDAFKKIEKYISPLASRRVLLVMADSERAAHVARLIGNGQVNLDTVVDGAAAQQLLQQRMEFDCLVLDISAPQAAELLEFLRGNERGRAIPVIVYAENGLTEAQEQLLHKIAQELTLKEVHSPERLLDEATLFLHQVESKLPPEQQSMLRQVHDKETILLNKKIILADDDSRNIFALGAVLEEKGVTVLIARNGEEALHLLDTNPDTALVLMDIMMPKMDGYEAMRAIRAQPRFRKLPIIALTAKAMKGDRTKCMESGANDYLSKPIDTDKLLSLLRIWLYR